MSDDSLDDQRAGDLPDRRLYVVDDDWKAFVKTTSDRERCYSKFPGEDFFHLIMKGEIYIARGNEKYCLTCALRLGLVTTDRLHWQKTPRKLGREPFV